MADNRIHISAVLPEAETVAPKKPKKKEKPKEKPKEKRKLPKWTDISYKHRMTIAFAGIAVMTMIVALLVLSLVWNRHFQSYTRQNMETTAASVALSIGREYETSGGWNDDTVNMAKTYCDMYPSMGILVVDHPGNNVHFDSTKYESSQGAVENTAISNANQKESNELKEASDASAKQGADKAESTGSTQVSDGSRVATIQTLKTGPADNTDMVIAPISAWGRTIGTVRVWVYGSETLLSQADIEFRDNSYRAMFFAAGIAILLACVVGYGFARNLVDPINRMAKTADEIKEGNLSARTGLKGEDEIGQLGETFDEMAESVERERDNERRLTTDVAHEIRTPLMAIQSTVEAMIDGVFKADEEHLDTVNNEVQRLSRMVDAILKLSRLENRTKPLKMDVLDLSEVIEGIVTTHQAFVTDSGLEMTYEAKGPVLVRGDADLIRQATANLISNAVRYTPEGGSIRVEVSHGEIMSNIVVEDTGIGLTPEEAKQVFDRFWRSDEGRSRESGGLGIGLAIVREIVDQHGGWVRVEGQKGQGARFTIHIPLYNAEAEAIKQREEERKKQQKAKQEAKAKAKQQQKMQQLEKQKQKAQARQSKENTGRK